MKNIETGEVEYKSAVEQAMEPLPHEDNENIKLSDEPVLKGVELKKEPELLKISPDIQDKYLKGGYKPGNIAQAIEEEMVRTGVKTQKEIDEAKQRAGLLAGIKSFFGLGGGGKVN